MADRNVPGPLRRRFTALGAALARTVPDTISDVEDVVAEVRALGLDDEQIRLVFRAGLTLEAFGARHLVDIFARVGAANAITSETFNQLAERGVVIRLAPTALARAQRAADELAAERLIHHPKEPPAVTQSNEVIHKYRIDVEDDVTVSMPDGATVLHAAALETPSTTFRRHGGSPVRTVHGRLELWARIDPQAPHVDRRFAIRGTGHVLGDVGEHIATVKDAPYVWHIFEGAP